MTRIALLLLLLLASACHLHREAGTLRQARATFTMAVILEAERSQRQRHPDAGFAHYLDGRRGERWVMTFWSALAVHVLGALERSMPDVIDAAPTTHEWRGYAGLASLVLCEVAGITRRAVSGDLTAEQATEAIRSACRRADASALEARADLARLRRLHERVKG